MLPLTSEGYEGSETKGPRSEIPSHLPDHPREFGFIGKIRPLLRIGVEFVEFMVPISVKEVAPFLRPDRVVASAECRDEPSPGFLLRITQERDERLPV
ncbi:MAG: hypothetical protein AAF591_23615, partial [Verrucomicrobiota bacterium]